MKVKLTIDIFSGRPNPVIIVEGAKAKKLLAGLRPEGQFLASADTTAPEPFQLGYRGIIIEQLDQVAADKPAVMRVTPDRLYAGETSAAATDTEFEKHIFDLLPDMKNVGNKKQFRAFVEEQINRFKLERLTMPELTPIIVQPVNTCKCAPPHDIAWWNTAGIRPFNNCYNYATNYRTNTFAQPGRAANQMYTSLSGCTVAAGKRSAKDGAVADSLIDAPTANNKCPADGHLVALVIAPNFDYHWYRKGPDGKWSHKPGSTAATLLDNAGEAITDPRTANRGPYTQFCTFMQVIHGRVMIK